MARPAEILQKSCQPWAPNYSICLVVRPLAARFASSQQTDGLIWCMAGNIFAGIYVGPAVRNHPLDQNDFKKNAGIERMSRWPVSNQFERFLRPYPK